MAKKGPKTKPNKLAQFLIDLAIDDNLRARFNQDRAAAIADRKLSKQATKALLSNDSPKLQLLINNQAHQVAARKAMKAKKSAKKR
jgi:hypothetical protein